MNNIYLREVEKFISYLSNLPEEKIVKLQNGVCNIRFVYNELDININDTDSPIDVDYIIHEFPKMKTRKEGEEYLLSRKLKRLDLEIILRKLDIPFQKKDSIEKLRDKIIEGTTGFRLRSQAIQGS
ncbi:MAG: hypothetical protein LBG45_01980 [Dysgonamonadaceae bacterium]|nr:hypothetical protein [Dysgonamonadaceae bacterium]